MISVVCDGRIPRDLSLADLQQALERTCVTARRPCVGSVTIAFISSERMTRLNREWMRKAGTTDVLSFPAMPIPGESIERFWGEIFLDLTRIRSEARRRSISFREEVLRDVVHGMLHLLGYDHATVAQELRMFTQQEKILASILHDV